MGKYCLATLSLPRQQRFDRLVFAENETNRLRHAWLGEYFSKWNANDNYYSMAQSLCFPSICSANEIRHLLLACKFVANFNVVDHFTITCID